MTSNPQEFQTLLERLGRADDQTLIIAHAAADGSFQTTTIGNDAVEIQTAIETLTSQQHHVWFEINPSTFDEPSGRSRAQHITRLTSLYADIDFKSGGMGNELAATELVNELSKALGSVPAAIVHTGGGLQAYWPVEDGQITDENRKLVATVLARWKQLAMRFAKAEGGALDSTFDLPRIFRVPGSANWKPGLDGKAVTAEFPKGWASFSLEELTEIFDDYAVDADPNEIPEGVVSAMADWDYAAADCKHVYRWIAEIATAQPGSRHGWLLAQSAQLYGMIRYGCITEQTFERARRLLDNRFTELCASIGTPRIPLASEIRAAFGWGRERAEAWSKEKLIDEMRGHARMPFIEALVGRPLVLPQAPAPVDSKPVIGLFSKAPIPAPSAPQQFEGQLALQVSATSQQRLTLASDTDAGNAELFAQNIRGRYIHIASRGWHRWDGTRYIPDVSNYVREEVKDLFATRLATTVDPMEQAWLRKSLNAGRMSATLNWAESVEGIATKPSELDSNGWELVTPAGVVDLRTGTLRPADPTTDRHTRSTVCSPAFGTAPTEWLRFLLWALGTPEQVAYFQRLCGMMVIGEQLEQIFPIMLGPQKNGKSTIIEILVGILGLSEEGGYAAQPNSIFLLDDRGQQHTQSLALLRGVRAVFSSEVPPNAKFNEERVKAITGEKNLTARLMRENDSTFKNTITLFLMANHLPTVSVGGPAFWRRIRRLDMPNVISDENRDTQLGARIIANEGAAILAWMIEGALEIVAHGEQPTESVLRAAKQYQYEEDHLARFIDQQMVEEDGAEISVETAYMLYRQFIERERTLLGQLTQPKFAREFFMYYPNARNVDDSLILGFRAKQAVLQVQPMGYGMPPVAYHA